MLLVLAFALWLAVRGGVDPAGSDRGAGGLTGIVDRPRHPRLAELRGRARAPGVAAQRRRPELGPVQRLPGDRVHARWPGPLLVGPGLPSSSTRLSYLAVLAALAAIRSRPDASRWRPLVSGSAELGGPAAGPATFRLGLAYVRQHPGLQLAVVTCGVVMFLGGPVIQLAPVFARDTFGVDERAYGFLAAAFGIGATAGSVVLGAYGDGVRRSRLIVKPSWSTAWRCSPWR